MRKLIVLLLIIGIFIFSGCQQNNESSVEQTLFATDFGNSVPRDFIGQVVDESHQPIVGATVTIGTSIQITDSKGFFLIKQASVKEKMACIKVSKTGFQDGFRSVIPLEDMNHLKIMLFPTSVTKTITTGSVNDISLSNNASLSLDGNFKTITDINYSGAVNVTFKYLDPTNSTTPDMMPGLLLGQNETSVMQALSTFGIFYVDFKSTTNESILPQSTYDIKLPIATAQQLNAPETITLWAFDNEKGHWILDGKLTKEANFYIGKISKASWFNASIASPAIISKFSVTNCNDQPLDNIRVSSENDFQSCSDNSYSNANGQTIGILPSTGTLTVKVNTVGNICPSLLYTKTFNAATESTNALQLKVACESSQEAIVQGVVNNCQGSPITNGYVWLEYGNRFLVSPINNGNYTFNVRMCVKVSDINLLQAIDLDNSSVSDQIQVTFKSGLVKVDPITTCTITSQLIAKDLQGNEYPLVQIGTQWWSQKNLQVMTYSDGTTIPQVSDPALWAKLKTGACCLYENKNENGITYGRLYNWYAIAGIFNDASLTDTSLRKKLAPIGYHIPLDTEIVVLTDFLGGQIKAGGKLKSAGTNFWQQPNEGATNGSGFSALPGGIRDAAGVFFYKNSGAYIASASEYNLDEANFLFLTFYDAGASIAHYNKKGAYSVRFVKD